MENETSVWILPSLIENFPFPEEFKSSLSDISRKDYKGNSYFPEHIPALDIDSYESSLHKAQMDNTVDAVLGICDKRSEREINPRLLLVELKMDCESPYNITIRDLQKKKSRSEEIIRSHSCSTIIDRTFCILFSESVAAQGRSWFTNCRRSQRDIDSWKIFFPSSFCHYINHGKKIEYSPSEKAKDIENAIAHHSLQGNLSQYEKILAHARQYIYDCNNRYMCKETQYIARLIVDSFENFPAENLDEFQKEYFFILRQDTLEALSRYL